MSRLRLKGSPEDDLRSKLKSLGFVRRAFCGANPKCPKDRGVSCGSDIFRSWSRQNNRSIGLFLLSSQW